MAAPAPYKLFFISTNEVWSGSEVLWYGSAAAFIKQGHVVCAATFYVNDKIMELQPGLQHYIHLHQRFTSLSFIQKKINRLVPVYRSKDLLVQALKQVKPQLVVISQGNNISSADMMELCFSLQLPFVTLTQLVSEVHWLWLTGDLHKRLKHGYEKSMCNFFVSNANKVLHEMMMAYSGGNNAVTDNPVVLKNIAGIHYSPVKDIYNIAFVGRIECFHKGLDILVKVLALDKWKSRPVHVNLYGSGPHTEIIESLKILYGIKNIFIKGFSASVDEVWQQNHLLVLPSRMEGQSLSLIEALHCNRAAVVTKTGGAAEIVTDNITGFIAQSATFNDVDEALERAWQVKEQWQQMGIQAGAAVRKLMPGNAIEKFNQQLMQLL